MPGGVTEGLLWYSDKWDLPGGGGLRAARWSWPCRTRERF